MELVDHSLCLRNRMQILQLHQNQHREALEVSLYLGPQATEITNDASISILVQLLIHSRV